MSEWQPVSNDTGDKLLGIWVSDNYMNVDKMDDEDSLFKLEALLRMIIQRFVNEGMVSENYGKQLYFVIVHRTYRIVPNSFDSNGGNFIMLGNYPAPGE